MHVAVRHGSDLVLLRGSSFFGGLSSGCSTFHEDLDFSAVGVHAVSDQLATPECHEDRTYVSEPWLWQSVYEVGGSFVMVASRMI